MEKIVIVINGQKFAVKNKWEDKNDIIYYEVENSLPDYTCEDCGMIYNGNEQITHTENGHIICNDCVENGTECHKCPDCGKVLFKQRFTGIDGLCQECSDNLHEWTESREKDYKAICSEMGLSYNRGII